jgi:ribosomal protein S6
MSKEENLDNEGITTYELAFHILPTVGDDGVNKVFEDLKGLVTKTGGKEISSSAPALLKLKYVMTKNVDSKKQKHDSAYFSWIKFEAMPDSILTLKSDLDHSTEILRYMIVKSEKDSNIKAEEVADMLSVKDMEEGSEKKHVRKEVVKKEDDGEIETKPEEESDKKSDEEKVDKAIDDLVENKEKKPA